VITRLVDDAEVDEGEPIGCAQLELVDRALPRLEVDLRRRRDGPDRALGHDPDACRVA
jgi:hypothetical protein